MAVLFDAVVIEAIVFARPLRSADPAFGAELGREKFICEGEGIGEESELTDCVLEVMGTVRLFKDDSDGSLAVPLVVCCS